MKDIKIDGECTLLRQPHSNNRLRNYLEEKNWTEYLLTNMDECRQRIHFLFDLMIELFVIWNLLLFVRPTDVNSIPTWYYQVAF